MTAKSILGLEGRRPTHLFFRDMSELVQERGRRGRKTYYHMIGYGPFVVIVAFGRRVKRTNRMRTWTQP